MIESERWISKRSFVFDGIEYVFDIYEKSLGGLLANCEAIPGMILHYRNEEEFENVIERILPSFLKFISGGE